MKIRKINTWDSHFRQWRLFEIISHSRTKLLRLSLIFQFRKSAFFHIERDLCNSIVIIFGVKFHYKNTHGGGLFPV